MAAGISRYILAGRLPRKNIPWEAAKEHFRIEEDHYFLPVGFDPSPYLNRAIQGATIVPRAAWFVSVPKAGNGGIIDSETPYLESDGSIERKKPWDKIHLEGEVESKFLFATALGSDIVPFALERVHQVVLPLEISKAGMVSLIDKEEALSHGFSSLAGWLGKVEKAWHALKKKGSKLNIYERLDFHKLLSSQKPKAQYRVIFTAAGTHMTSTVVTNADLSADIQGIHFGGFIVEHKFYVVHTSSAEEANYLCSILNSPAIDKVIKPYQTVGLLGERDIERRALEVVPIPVYDSSDHTHKTLAELGLRARQQALRVLPSVKTLKTGDKRSAIRDALSDILEQIDQNVRKIVKLDTFIRPGPTKVVRGQTKLEF